MRKNNIFSRVIGVVLAICISLVTVCAGPLQCIAYADSETGNEIVSIYISSKPYKTEYQVGESLELEGAELALRYGNGNTEYIDVTEDMVSGFDNQTLGRQSVTVRYQDFIAKFSVEVYVKTVTHIGISNLPYKTRYEIGENLDLEGANIDVYYDNDYTEQIDITEDMVSGFDSLTLGTKIITVNYEGFIVKFPVEVYVKSVTSMMIWHTPYKNEYSIGENLNLEGTEIYVYYDNGDSEIINVTEDMVSGFDSQTAGTKIITVTYEGFTDTFEVYVYQRENAATELNIIKDRVYLCEKTSDIKCFLGYEFLPEGSVYESITWTSSDENIVSVGDNGYITPVSAGTATITATSEYGLTDTVTIVVSSAEEITVGESISTVLPNAFLSKGYKFTPSESGRYKITVSASSRLGTTVRDSDGTHITSQHAQYSQLSFSAEAGETYYFINSTEMGDEVDVNYTISLSKVISATQLNIIEDRIKLCEQTSNMRCGLASELLPEGSEYESITWTSSDESIVKVGDNGYITPVSAGTAIITATSASGLTDTVTIEVSAAQEISIGESISATIPAEYLSIGYKFTPTESGRYAVTINSNYYIGTTVRLKNTYDSPIVSDTGYNYTLAFNAEAGETYYFINDTQTSSNVDATYTISLAKTESITSVEISRGDSFEGYEGETYYLNAVQYPLGAGRESVEWTSSNSDVVYVRSYDGWIELRSAGTAVITVTTESGLTDTCTVTVKEDPVAGIELVSGTSFEYIENYNGYYNTDYNGNEYFYYYINGHSDAVIKIIYKDGTYTTANVGERVDGIYVNAYGWTQYDSHWTLGSENYVEITYRNSTCKMPVTVKKNPVEKLEFVSGDVSIVENTGYYTSTYDPETGGYIKYYCYSYSQFYSDIYVKIVYTDGSSEIVNLGTAVDGYYFNYNDEQHKNPWLVGNEYYFTVSFLNKSVNIPVTIVESPVEKIELVSGEASFVENTGGYKSEIYDEETGEYIDSYYYSYYSVLNDLSVKIIYKDGSSKIVNLADNYVDGYYDDGYYFDFYDEQDINPWVLGSENYFTASYLGSSLQIPVTIVESPVDRIEVVKSPTKVYVYGDEIYGYTYNGEYRFTPDNFNGIEFIVYFKDGTSKIFNGDDIDKYGRIGEYYCVVDRYYVNGTQEYAVSFNYMGIDSDEYTVSVVESPISSIEVVKSPDPAGSQYCHPTFIGMQIKINYLSGESEIITLSASNITYEYEPEWGIPMAYINVGDNQIFIKYDWYERNYYVSFLGANCCFEISRVENSNIVEDVTIENPSLTGDGMKVYVTYENGEKETIVVDPLYTDDTMNDFWYYSCTMTDNGLLCYDIRIEYFDGEPVKYCIWICGREIEIEVDGSEETVGDINGDGFIGVADLTMLRNALLSGAEDEAYDVNGDGVFDARDTVALKKIVLELEIICGDADGDGNVNASDLAILRNIMLDAESFDETETAVYDVNENGVVDAADLVRLKKQIAA